MAGQFVSVERRGRIAIVRFDRGDGRNAMSRTVMRELTEAARSFEDDIETNAVILTGSAEVFTVGYDLKDPEAKGLDGMGLAERRRHFSTGPRMCKAWEDVAPFTIAAIEGWCVGGGVALSVSLDFRVCGVGSTFYVAEIERGMNMSWQSLPRITNLIGPARAKQLAILAEMVPAEQALDFGLVQEVVPAGTAFDRAMALAERVAALPPVPVRMIKRDIDAYANALGHATSQMDLDQYALCQSSDDYKEGVAAFLARRPAKYTGR